MRQAASEDAKKSRNLDYIPSILVAHLGALISLQGNALPASTSLGDTFMSQNEVVDNWTNYAFNGQANCIGIFYLKCLNHILTSVRDSNLMSALPVHSMKC